MTAPRIATERLLLRRWRSEDLTPFAAMCADREVMKWIGDGATKTRSDVEESIARFEHRWTTSGYGLFAVELKDTGTFIGFAGFNIPDFLPEIMPAVELGWRLGRPYWGRGYATEAASAALRFGRTHCGLESVVSICQVGNVASERVALKLGMTVDRETVESTHNRPLRVYRSG